MPDWHKGAQQGHCGVNRLVFKVAGAYLLRVQQNLQPLQVGRLRLYNHVRKGFGWMNCCQGRSLQSPKVARTKSAEITNSPRLVSLTSPS